MDEGDERTRNPRSAHEQQMPTWALRDIDPLIRHSLDGNWQRWKRTVQGDPCAYCGNPGGEPTTSSRGDTAAATAGTTSTGSCHACNRAKGTMSALPFIAGMTAEVRWLPVQLGRFGPLWVAATDLAEVVGGRNDWSVVRTVLETLLDRHPETDAALAYCKRRHRGHRHRRWNHMLATRPDGADAGNVCRELGGGGSPRRGGVQSATPRFTPNDDTITNESTMVPADEKGENEHPAAAQRP